MYSLPLASQTSAPADSAPAASKSTKKIPYKGTISAIDTPATTVTIKSTKGDMVMAVTPATKFKGGKALSDFAVGDAVTGSYTKDDTGSLTAASLHKKKVKAAASTTAAPASTTATPAPAPVVSVPPPVVAGPPVVSGGS